MKKNIYDIMDEANEKELDSIIQNIEYHIPSGINTKSIKEKTLKKCGVKRKPLSMWIRGGAIAACLALIITAIPTAMNYTSNQTTGDLKITEIGIATQPSIGYPDSISYTYYYPLENGVCYTEDVFIKLTNGKSDETWATLLTRFFDFCKLDVTVTDWKLDKKGEQTVVSPDGKTVTHIIGVTTVSIMLEGTATLDDHTLRCLVNTIDSITYAQYIKLYYNGEAVSIDGKCPEEGFVNFH